MKRHYGVWMKQRNGKLRDVFVSRSKTSAIRWADYEVNRRFPGSLATIQKCTYDENDMTRKSINYETLVVMRGEVSDLEIYKKGSVQLIKTAIV